MNRIKALGKARGLSPGRGARKIDIAPPRFSVKPLGWIQFTWDLTSLPAVTSEFPEHYQISPATAEDTTELRKVFSSCFMLDPVWSPAIGEVMQRVQALLDVAFTSANKSCLALRHGSRIIGATLLALDPEADNHLAPGPSILSEYRNRGFGTLLLEHALDRLRQAGHSSARAIVRDIAPAAKFLYPKFGGVSRPIDLVPLVAT